MANLVHGDLPRLPEPRGARAEDFAKHDQLQEFALWRRFFEMRGDRHRLPQN